MATQPKRLPEPIVESARFSRGEIVEWDDTKLTAKGAPIFAPPFDSKSGHYRSDSGRLYSGDKSFHRSVLEAANAGLMGWGKHPKKTSAGAEMRDINDAILSTVEGTAVESALKDGTPAIRVDIQFLTESAYRKAKAGRKRFGPSMFVPNPLGYRDTALGKEVVAAIDPDEKWSPSVDIVESAGAVPSLAESAETEPQTKETDTMTDAEKQALQEQIKSLEGSLAKLQGDVKESAEIKKQLAALKQEQIVNSRLSEKKLDAKHVTAGLRKVLTACESVESIDAAIDEHKKLLASLEDPIKEAAARERVLDVRVTQTTVTDDVADKGIHNIVAEMASGASRDGRQRQISDKLAKHGLSRAFDWKKRDAETQKLRKAVWESASLKGLLEACTGRTLGNVEDVSEAVLDSSSFSQTITGLLGAQVISAYDITSEGFVSPKLMNIFQSPLKTETWVGYTQPAGVASVAEGAAYPDATMTDKYVGHPALTKYGARVRITREEILWDQKQQVLMRANSVGEALAYDVEDRRIKAIIDNSTTTYYPSGSPAALYTVGNGNLLTGQAMTGSYLPIEAACNVLTAITDGNSRRLATNSRRPLSILVPQSLFMRAWFAVNPMGTQLRTGGSSTVNEAGNPFAGTNVYVSNILDAVDPTTWYIAGAGGFQKQFGVKQNWPFEVVQLPQAEVAGVSNDIVGGIRCSIMEAPFAWDYRYVVKVTT